MRVGGFTVPVALLRRTLPIAALLLGCVLLGAGVAGVARMDAPLRAAVTEQPATPQDRNGVDVNFRHRHRDGDCPPTPPSRT